MSDFDQVRAELVEFRHLGRRARYDQMNRLWLLTVHVGIGLGVMVCFINWQLPLTWVYTVGTSGLDYWACTLAPGVGAGLLAAGLMLHRKLLLEALGMLVMFLWDLTGVVMVYRFVQQPAAPGPAQYQVALYSGLGMLMFIHLITLLVFYRRGRQGRV